MARTIAGRQNPFRFRHVRTGRRSSDATNICASAVLDNGEWLINGEKSISPAQYPRCKILIVMVKTNPENRDIAALAISCRWTRRVSKSSAADRLLAG